MRRFRSRDGRKRNLGSLRRSLRAGSVADEIVYVTGCGSRRGTIRVTPVAQNGLRSGRSPAGGSPRRRPPTFVGRIGTYSRYVASYGRFGHDLPTTQSQVSPPNGRPRNGSLSWKLLDRITAEGHQAATHQEDQLAEVVQFGFEPEVIGRLRAGRCRIGMRA